MKKNYENEDLGVSDGDFPKPENMSINLDCTKKTTTEENKNELDDDLDDIDF